MTEEIDQDVYVPKAYHIGTKLGQGTYAVVRTASYYDWRGKKVEVACKIFDKTKATDECLNKFFPRELDVLRKIKHPNVIELYNIIETGQKVFIFMKRAQNGDLYEYVKRHGVLSETKCKRWFSQIVKGVRYLHDEVGVAHRDLKCENILLTKEYQIIIGDFGFARFSKPDLYSNTFCGSATYAAPEIIANVSYRPMIADVWSLGVVLFVMLNASFPFDDSALSQLLSNQISKNFHFSPTRATKLSTNAQSLVCEILEPNVHKRSTLERVQAHKWFKPSVTSAAAGRDRFAV